MITDRGMPATSRPAKIMTGEDEDEEALGALARPPNDDVPGHWTIQQATAFLIYGDSQSPPPLSVVLAKG